jgi:hypothetical protein
MAQLAGKEAIPDAYREDVPKLLDSIKVEQDGQVVRLTVQVPKDLAGRALDDAMKQYRARRAGAGGSSGAGGHVTVGSFSGAPICAN